MYKVFHRTWWRENPDWPDGLEPHAGRKTVIGFAKGEKEAQAMCRKYNRENTAGRLSRKAEYEDV
jgi:hypothetical protein